MTEERPARQRFRHYATSAAVLTLFIVQASCTKGGIGEEPDAPFKCAHLLWKHSDQEFPWDTRLQVVSAHVEVGEPDRAVAVVDHIDDPVLKAMAYLTILESAAPELDAKLGREILQRAYWTLLFAGPFREPTTNQEAFVSASAVNLLALLGWQFASAEMPGLASTCLSLAERRSLLLPARSRPTLLGAVALGHALLGNDEKSEQLLEEVLRVLDLPVVENVRGVQLTSLALMAAMAEQEEAARRFLALDEEHRRRNDSDGVNGFAASLHAGVYLELGDIGRALELTRRNQDAQSRVRDLCEIGVALMDSGAEEDARSLIAEIEAAALANDKGLASWRAEAAARFAALAARLGDKDKALSALQDARTWVAKSDEDRDSKDDALSDLAAAHCKVGDCGKGLRLLAEVDNDYEVVVALLRIGVIAHERRHTFSEQGVELMSVLCPKR